MAWNETTQEQYKRPSDRLETDLTDEEWELIEPLLPSSSMTGRPRSTDLREVFNAIQFMLGTGCRWRALPPCFLPFTTVQGYYGARRDDGVFETMLDVLRGRAGELAGSCEDPTAVAVELQVALTGSRRSVSDWIGV